MTVPLVDAQGILKWGAQKLYYISKEQRARVRKVWRGEVYWCDFGENIGSEQCKKRPAVVLQNDSANRTSPNTIVAPITSAGSTNSSVFNLNRPAGDPVTGYVLLGNIVTVSKARIGDYIAKLSNPELDGIEDALYNSIGVYPKINSLRENLQRTTSYLDKVKQQRNEATDALEIIKVKLGLDSDSDITSIVAKLDEVINK